MSQQHDADRNKSDKWNIIISAGISFSFKSKTLPLGNMILNNTDCLLDIRNAVMGKKEFNYIINSQFTVFCKDVSVLKTLSKWLVFLRLKFEKHIGKMYWLLVGFESIIKLLFNKYPIMILPSGPAQGSPVCLGAEPSPAWQSLSLDSHKQKPFWADHSLTLPTE